MKNEQVGLYNDMRGMYLSGASIRCIIKMYGIMSWYETIDTLDYIKRSLTSKDVLTRKLNKAKSKLGIAMAKQKAIHSKELKHQERARHFKTKKLAIEQSIIKLHACIDKLNTV